LFLVELSLKSTCKTFVFSLLLRSLIDMSGSDLCKWVLSGHLNWLHHWHKRHVSSLVKVGIHWVHALWSRNKVTRELLLLWLELLRRWGNRWLWLTRSNSWSLCNWSRSRSRSALLGGTSSSVACTTLTCNLAAHAAENTAGANENNERDDSSDHENVVGSVEGHSVAIVLFDVDGASSRSINKEGDSAAVLSHEERRDGVVGLRVIVARAVQDERCNNTVSASRSFLGKRVGKVESLFV